jgi:RecA/RadA recombinase
MRTKNTSATSASIASGMKRKTVRPHEVNRVFMPTGSILFNMALSENPFGGAVGGRVLNIVGDSGAGKSILATTILAASHADPRLAKYRFYRDDTEEADSFDMVHLFGQGLADRIEPPDGTREEPKNSERLDQFEAFLYRALDNGPCIYVLDSLDALTTKEEMERTAANVKKVLNDKETDNSYGMEAAKKMSSILRQIDSKLAKNNSLLIIVSQTRANIVKFSPVKLTRSGGQALEFYASYVAWLTKCEMIRENKHKRVIGVHTEIKVSKNKVTGKVRELPMYIFYDYGMDDIRANIEWMIEEGFWTQAKGGNITAEELNTSGSLAELIRHVEENHMEDTLADIVGRCWMQIEEDIKLQRKARFQ